MNRLRRVGLAFLGAIAVAGAILVTHAGSGELDTAPRNRLGGRSRSRIAAGGWDAALRLLSPPGAGYDSSNVALTTGSGGAVTVTSATPRQYCPDSSGALRSLAANKPCVVDGQSLKVRSAVANSLLQSEDLTTTWTAVNTGTVSANTWDFGTGSSTGDTITDDSASSEGVQQVVALGPATYTFACYLKQGGGTPISTARLASVVTGGTGSTTCNVTGLTSSSSRQTCTFTAGAGTTQIAFQVLVGAAAGDQGTLPAGGCTVVASAVPGDYCPTTTGASTCSAETVTAPFSGGVAPAASPWCVSANLTRSATDPAWNAGGASRVFWSNDPAGNGDVVFYTTALGSLNVDLRDSSNTLKTWAVAGALTTETSVKVRACYDGTNITMWKDGTALSPSTSGAGTGVLAALTLNSAIGTYTSAFNLNAAIQLCFARGSSGCQ